VGCQEQVDPFIEAVLVTLREMAGVEPAAREVRPAAGQAEFGDVSAMLLLHAGGEGYLVLSFPWATATELASRVLADAAALDDGMVRDCAGELANVVAGQAKALLFGTPDHFTFSTPTVTAGPPPVPDGNWWSVDFLSEVGPFHLHLRLPG
jgi:chemotaxis protein CheX